MQASVADLGGGCSGAVPHPALASRRTGQNPLRATGSTLTGPAGSVSLQAAP